MELLAHAVTVRIAEAFGRLAEYISFLDNDPASGWMVKGFSARSDACAIIDHTWLSWLRLSCAAWYGRVPSESNPADALPRSELLQGLWIREGGPPEWLRDAEWPYYYGYLTSLLLLAQHRREEAEDDALEGT